MARFKFGNRKTCGFDSRKEYKRAKELERLQELGEISNLQTQVKFEVLPKFEFNGEKIRPMSYIADFVYCYKGKIVIEDVKGFRTPDYKLKAKLMKWLIANGKIKADDFVET